MSILAVPHARPEPVQTPAWMRYVSAELIRSKHTAVQWFPLVGLVIGLISSTVSFFSSGAHDASGILSWQAMYVTGMAAPLLALLAGLAESREKKYREGGTALRPASQARIRGARLAVLALSASLFHLANFGVSWFVAVTQSRADAARILVAGFLAWICCFATLASFSVVARYFGLVGALLASVAYQIGGTLFAEHPLWWAFPPAWPVRALLPTLGIHANAVPLEPDAPLRGESPAFAIALNILFAAVATLAAVYLVPRPGGRNVGPGAQLNQHSDNSTELAPVSHQVTGMRSFHDPFSRIASRAQSSGRFSDAVYGLSAPVLRTAITPLVCTTVAALLAMVPIYSAGFVKGAFTFGILPLGAGIMPVILWNAVGGAWAHTSVENGHIRQAFLAWNVIVVTVVSLVASVAFCAAGGDGAEAGRTGALWLLTGAVLAFASTGLTVRFGSGAAIAATVVWTVVSVTLGGDVLAETWLWLVAFPAWPETAANGGRFGPALVTFALAVSVLAGWILKEMRDFERRS